MKIATRLIIFTTIAMVVAWVVRETEAAKEEARREATYRQVLQEIREETANETNSQQTQSSSTSSSTSSSSSISSPQERVKSAIRSMSSYSGLVSALGSPTKIDTYIDGTHLAVWRIDDITVHLSETKKGTTKVYAFEGSVSNQLIYREFDRHLIK